MYDVWDWYDYDLHTTSGMTYSSSTMFNIIGDALDDAIDRSVRVQGTIESIDITCEENDNDYY